MGQNDTRIQNSDQLPGYHSGLSAARASGVHLHFPPPVALWSKGRPASVGAVWLAPCSNTGSIGARYISLASVGLLPVRKVRQFGGGRPDRILIGEQFRRGVPAPVQKLLTDSVTHLKGHD